MNYCIGYRPKHPYHVCVIKLTRKEICIVVAVVILVAIVILRPIPIERSPMQCPPSERMVFEKELKKNKYVDNSLYTDGCQKGAAWVKVISEIKLHNFRNDKVQHGKSNDYAEEEMKLSLTAPIISSWTYQLAKSLHTVFEKYKVGYVLDYGTALGAERHNGLIPWDDDLDIAVHNDFETVLMNDVAKELDAIYNITWIADVYSNYKFFHKFNSLVVPSMKEKNNPWRYPYADINMYTYDDKYDVLALTGDWRRLNSKPGVGFDPNYKWPNGTNLVKFGDFEMRVSVENRKYLENCFSTCWINLSVVGVTKWYDHYNDHRSKTVEFLIPDTLYHPARPFIHNDCSTNYTCNQCYPISSSHAIKNQIINYYHLYCFFFIFMLQ